MNNWEIFSNEKDEEKEWQLLFIENMVWLFSKLETLQVLEILYKYHKFINH